MHWVSTNMSRSVTSRPKGGGQASENRQTRPLHIIIVGAGIAGLTLARALELAPRAAPITYTLLEARDELAPQQGAGIALAPGGSRILDQLGAYSELEKQLVPVSSSGVHDDRGKMLLPGRSDAALLVGSRMGYPFGLVERRSVVVALLNQISRRDSIHTGKRVMKIAHPPNSNQHQPVTVICADGSQYQGDVVVGADGVRSKVRSEMWRAVDSGVAGNANFDVDAEKREMTAEYRCLFGISSPVPGYPPGCSDDTIGRHVSTMVASGPDKVFWFLFGKLPRTYGHDEIPRFDQHEAARFAQQHAQLPVRDQITMGDLWNRRITTTLVPLEEADHAHWTAGRFAIIGDGAHKMTPQTGSGGMLAMDNAAALANVLYDLDCKRLQVSNSTHTGAAASSPITTAQIEASFNAYHDTRRRHVRTTAIIKEAAALARLQGLRTLLDRLIAWLLFPRAGDARADQLCGDAVGAEHITYLPLPDRSFTGTMPFNPEYGIGRDENAVVRRALCALPLLLMGLLGALSMGAVVPLEGAAKILTDGVYRWTSAVGQAETSVPGSFYGLSWADNFARPGVMRFIVSREHFMLQNFSLFADYGVWYAIMLIESSRRCLRLTLLQCALPWGLINMKGFAIFVPVYYFVHYIASPISKFAAPDMRLTDASHTKTVFPVILMTHYATFITAYLSPVVEQRSAAAYLWEFFPLWICLLQASLTYIFPSTVLQDRLRNVTRDLPAIRMTIVALSVFSAAVWQYALWHSLPPSSFDLFVPIIGSIKDLSFEELFAETLKWDQVFFALPNILWIGLLFNDLRTAGYIKHGWLELAFWAVVLHAIGGNGFMLGMAWLYREEMLATRRHKASAVPESVSNNNMLKA